MSFSVSAGFFFSLPVHAFGSFDRSIITQDDIKHRVLVTITHYSLIDQTAHDFTVLDDQPSIIRTEIRNAPFFFDVGLGFGFEIDLHLALLVRSEKDVEDLFPGPKSLRLYIHITVKE